MKWVVIGGAALLVLWAVKAASAPRWDYVEGYRPGSGVFA